MEFQTLKNWKAADLNKGNGDYQTLEKHVSAHPHPATTS